MNLARQPARDVCVLVVDDFDRYRAHVLSILASQPNLRVIAEANDGLDAIEKARNLNPTVVLMDIGLPKLNGIDATREILSFAPDSKVIFVTQENDKDVMAAGLAAGGQGYVLKLDAGRELLSAVEVVLRGEVFVSSTLEQSNERTAVPSPQQVCPLSEFSRKTKTSALARASALSNPAEKAQTRNGHLVANLVKNVNPVASLLGLRVAASSNERAGGGN